MKLDGYIRVSRTAGRAGESFISPDVQRDKIEKWAEMRGVEIAAWQTDLDESGGKLSRPGLDLAMQRLRDGLTDGIAVARLDRLSRAGVGDALKLIEDIEAQDGQIAAVDLGIDPTTPFGEFATTVMLALARMERRRIADSFEVSRRRAVGRGVHISSKTAAGYARGDDQRLVIENRRWADAVRSSFEARAAGATWSELSAILEKAGLPTSYGNANWSQRSVSHLISNKVYLGEARSGEFVEPNAHEAIVDEPVWQAAQREPGQRSPRGTSLLSGIVRCAGCRYALKPDKMKDRKGRRVRTYRCRGKRAGGSCEAPATVLGSVIEPWIEEQFFNHLGDLELRGVQMSGEVEDAEKALVGAEGELSAYIETTSALRDRAAFRAGLEQRESAVEKAERALGEARALTGFEELPDVVELRTVWPDLSLSEKRQVLSGAIHAVFLRSAGRANVPISERAIIKWKGDGPDDLPGSGKRGGELIPFDW